MQNMYYIGLDVHRRTISYCLKDGSGTIHAEGSGTSIAKRAGASEMQDCALTAARL